MHKFILGGVWLAQPNRANWAGLAGLAGEQGHGPLAGQPHPLSGWGGQWRVGLIGGRGQRQLAGWPYPMVELPIELLIELLVKGTTCILAFCDIGLYDRHSCTSPWSLRKKALEVAILGQRE